jgi:hypothetical protein
VWLGGVEIGRVGSAHRFLLAQEATPAESAVYPAGLEGNRMEEKYQVFVSSTFKDLEMQRKAAIQVVVECRHIPIALDTFGARSERDREVIDTMIEESQILILIIGHRYGDRLDGSRGRSYTEYEYEKAVEAGLRVLAFFLDEREANAMIRASRKGAKEKAEAVLKLDAFREKVRKGAKGSKGVMYSVWHRSTTFDQFLWLIGKSLKDLVMSEKNRPKRGWLPASRQETAKTVEIALRNEFVLESVKSLNQFERLDQRCNEQTEEKRVLARLFRDRFGHLITDGTLNLFFDSGSTPAYVAREVGELLLDRGMVRGQYGGVPELFTNNALAFLQLWLNARIPVSLLPSSPPSDPYGACYGILEQMIDRSRPPRYDQTGLSGIETEAVERLRVEMMTLLRQSRFLIVGSASGVQLSKEHELHASEGSTVTDKVKGSVEQCYGFHVGSIHNKLFKRALYATGLPVVITIDYHKVDHNIDVGRCHFVFDQQFTWDDFSKRHPLAFCIGGPTVRIEQIAQHLFGLGFDIERSPAAWAPTAVLATNPPFRMRFPEMYPTLHVGRVTPKSKKRRRNNSDTRDRETLEQ